MQTQKRIMEYLVGSSDWNLAHDQSLMYRIRWLLAQVVCNLVHSGYFPICNKDQVDEMTHASLIHIKIICEKYRALKSRSSFIHKSELSN